MLALPAHAAALPDGAQEILDAAGTDTEDFLHLDLSQLFDLLVQWGFQALDEPLTLARRAALFLTLACGVGLAAGGGTWGGCIELAAVLGFGVLCLPSMTALMEQVGEAARDCQLYLTGFVPVYAGVALLMGQTTGATVYSTLFYAVSALLSWGISSVVLPVLQIYFCLAVSAAVWGDSGIGRAAALFARCFTLLLRLCSAAFTFVLGLQNVLAAGSDRAAVRVGKSLLSAAVPVVGDAAAAALSGASAAVGLLKGSLALAAAAALGACFVPVLAQCAVYWLLFSLAGILASGTGQKRSAQICTLFGEGARMCGAVLVLYFFLVILATLLLLIGGNGGAL